MNQEIILVILSAVVLNALITHLLISGTVKATRRDKYLSQQINILIKIAQKHGVTDEELNEILQK